MLIRWGALVPAVGIAGPVLGGLINTLVFYSPEEAVFKVKFYGPNGYNLLLPENFGDIEQAKYMAESYLETMLLRAMGRLPNYGGQYVASAEIDGQEEGQTDVF